MSKLRTVYKNLMKLEYDNKRTRTKSIVVNSIDADGVKQGFDLEMLSEMAKRVTIPIIASGGAGCMEHFKTLFTQVPQVDAGLAASIFHRKEVPLPELKAYLEAQGIPMRILREGE